MATAIETLQDELKHLHTYLDQRHESTQHLVQKLSDDQVRRENLLKQIASHEAAIAKLSEPDPQTMGDSLMACEKSEPKVSSVEVVQDYIDRRDYSAGISESERASIRMEAIQIALKHCPMAAPAALIDDAAVIERFILEGKANG
jgi:chromosome segregation ATPase